MEKPKRKKYNFINKRKPQSDYERRNLIRLTGLIEDWHDASTMEEKKKIDEQIKKVDKKI